MSDEDLSYKVTADVSKAERDLNKLINQFVEATAAGTLTDKMLDRLEKQTVAVSSSVKGATAALAAQSQELRKLGSYAKAMDAYAAATRRAADAQLRFKSNTNLKNFTIFGKQQDPSVAARVPSSFGAQSVRNNGYTPNALSPFVDRQRRASFEQMKANTALVRSNQNVQRSFEGIANTRYAMFSVARSLTVVSAATLGLSYVAIKTAADYETLFASVQRVANTDPATFGKLKDDLIDLSTTIPGTVEDITRIATLGGQLGIAAGDIDSFTETVLKFSATTNVSADQAAESLGRVAQLTGTSASEYSNLASAIYQTGVTSVATEADILSMTEQIAVSGRQAGFSAEQTVALASALASLGVQPERARGSLQQIFALITNAVDNGGTALDSFARISGQTSDAFQKQWKTDAQGAFLQFVEGLGKADDAGQNITNLLGDVGIKGLRAVDVMKRLAQNTEVYSQAIDESSSAFEANTALNEGYAVVADTLNAKLQVLGNTLKAIMEAANNNGPLKLLVDMFQKVLNVMLAVSRTETGKVIGGVIIAFTALIGVVALVGAGVTATVAAILAAITAMRFMTKDATEQTSVFRLATIAITDYAVATGRMTVAQAEAAIAAGGLSGAMTGVAATSRIAAVAIRGIKYALVSTGVGIALVALGEVVSYFAKQTEGATQSVKDMTAALDADAAAGTGFVIAADRVVDYGKVLDNTQISQDAWDRIISGSSTYADEFAKAMDDASRSVEDFKVTIGDDVTKQFLDAFSNSDAVRKAIDEGLVPKDLDFTKLTQAFATGGQQGGERYLKQFFNYDQWSARVAELNDLMDFGSPNYDPKNWSAYNLELQQLQARFETYNALLGVGEGKTNDLAGAIQDAGYAARIAGTDVAGAGDAAGEAGAGFEDGQQSISDYTSTLFDTISTAMDVQSALYGLGQTLQAGGNDWSVYSEAGRGNLNNLVGVMNALAAQSPDDAATIASNFQGLYEALIAGGYASAGSLAFLQQAIANLKAEAGLKEVKGAVIDLTSLFAGYRTSANKAATSTDRVGRSAAAAAKKIRTLSDYVSDLSSVMKKAFEFRFGLQQASDDTVSATYAISKAFEEARDKVRSLRLEIMALNASLDTLKSDQATLEYQLQIAVLYGDSLRTQEIQAELAQNAADQAKATQDLSDKTKEQSKAQEDATATLTGNSEAAVDQRKAVADLVQSVEDQIVAYANAGHSQKEVAAYAKKLRDQLAKQLEQWGYNKSEIKKYLASLDDVVRIVGKIPRNLTIKADADTDPAKKALDEFFSKYDNKSVSVTPRIGGAGNPTQRGRRDGAAYGKGFAEGVAKARAKVQKYPGEGPNGMAYRYVYDDGSVSRKFFRKGGYTGDISPSAEAGVVHGREFVMNEAATTFYGKDQLQAMMVAAQSGRSYTPTRMSGGGGSGPVELSAYDRALLSAARVVQATLVLPDGRVLAQVVGEEQQNERRRRG